MLTAGGTISGSVPLNASLLLRHGQTILSLDHKSDGATFGRDASCTIVTTDPKASRIHAKIERRRDKFFLMDQSTNGTYVSIAGEAELALRREEIMLRGKGQIVFGHSINDAGSESVSFEIGR
jgi:adenylate cyclase